MGDGNANGLLDPNETWLYEATTIATEGQYTNIATVTAEGLLGTTVTDSDPSNHFGFNPRTDIIVIGNDKGPSSVPLVTVLEAETGDVLSDFLAYEAEYAGGVRVATGDLDGDGVDEIITAPGKAHTPEIRVFRLGTDADPDAWEELVEFRTLAYDSDFTGGVNIAIGDVDGDGRNDIVTTPSRGAYRTKVFRNVLGDGDDPIEDTPYREFFAFGPDFISGSVVTLGDMNLDGLPEVIVGNVGGRRSTINAFDVSGSPNIVRTFHPFGDQMRGGVSIALREITPDGVPDLIVGAGYRGQSAVEIIDGDVGSVLDSFAAYDSNAPVRVAVLGDKIVTTQGPNGNTNEIRSFDLVINIGGVTVVPDPLSTIHLDDLNDPRLFGAYYLDVLNLFVKPDTPDELEEPIDERDTGETTAESERESGHGSEVIHPPSRVLGDSNGDGVFNSSDLVVVFAAGEYEDHIARNSTFETGDWNQDGDFNSSDLVFVFRQGTYTRRARSESATANVENTSEDNSLDRSLDLVARDRLFEREDELWALRDLLDDSRLLGRDRTG